MKMRKLLFIISILLLTGCSNNWDAFVYPYGTSANEKTWKMKKGFSTLEECRDWAVSFDNGNSDFDYECGFKCHSDKTFGNICKKTVQ